MVESLPSFIDLGIIISNILGGLIALLIAVGISRWEFNRQEKQRKNNWYRSIHNICVRVRGSKDINHRGADDEKIQEYSRLYGAFANQIQDALPDAPEEVGLELFNALQNVQFSCIRYEFKASSDEMNKLYLQRRHEEIIQFSNISQYIIEDEIDPDIDYLDELDGEELEQAQEDYEEWVAGTLYEEENERVDEMIRSFRQLE